MLPIGAVLVLALASALISLDSLISGEELLQNGGFESTSYWDCSNIHCALSNDKHSGHHSIEVSGRHENYESPTQNIHLTPGHSYHVSGWVKLLTDPADQHGELFHLEIGYTFQDGRHQYVSVAARQVYLTDGWVHLSGGFTASNTNIKAARLYFPGPVPTARFLVDEASVTSVNVVNNSNVVIDKIRKSNIHINVTTASNINKNDLRIHVLQTRKSFPFGVAVNAWRYDSNIAGGKYRDFIHKHFNWATLAGSLRWNHVEPKRGVDDYSIPLPTIHGLRNHNIKIRGHNLVWSVPQWVPDWVQQLSSDDLRHAVKSHFIRTMNTTRGLLEHWDVNNENLYSHWYQERLNDPHYNLELFRMAHQQDPHVKLFLNDVNVVINSARTKDYLDQAKEFKAANVGLYGMGAESHFGVDQEPDPAAIKDRLDILAQAGVPIWITELDTQSADENKRAHYYENALRTFYGHPAVEGIIFWGFWDKLMWRGPRAALVKGENLEELTAAGRRVFDLLENQWMTDDTRVLSQTGSHYTVRGFHGDYEVHVIYKGHDLSNLKQTFTLGKNDHTLHINVHT
ncbi:anti-sigma-I factor RsgI6-like [Littorina saxatilis]|uniref:GH10 domain-containing protein n=1 Tax=Littorina saxatilis TaxID=31220 RepID=A0AAN9BFQ6_9CAEN